MIPGSFVATSQNSKKKKKKKHFCFLIRVLIGGLLDELAPGFVRLFNLSLRRIAAVVVVTLISRACTREVEDQRESNILWSPLEEE
jgi:hypothetical protein